jgi:ornithine cyclodeaminase
VAVGGAAAEAALRKAGLVMTATSAATPVFDSALLREDVVVGAVGSHYPGLRELDTALMARAQIVAEDPATCLREAGDIVLAVGEGAVDPGSIMSLAGAVTGAYAFDPARAVVFKSTGMSWEDLVIAQAIVDAA